MSLRSYFHEARFSFNVESYSQCPIFFKMDMSLRMKDCFMLGSSLTRCSLLLVSILVSLAESHLTLLGLECAIDEVFF